MAFAPCAVALRSWGVDEDLANVIDVRQGGASDHLIIQGGEEAMSHRFQRLLSRFLLVRTHPHRAEDDVG